jgi:hypothetical protein
VISRDVVAKKRPTAHHHDSSRSTPACDASSPSPPHTRQRHAPDPMKCGTPRMFPSGKPYAHSACQEQHVFWWDGACHRSREVSPSLGRKRCIGRATGQYRKNSTKPKKGMNSKRRSGRRFVTRRRACSHPERTASLRCRGSTITSMGVLSALKRALS